MKANDVAAGAEQPTYLAILKRCGLVLVVVGALDIAYMVWCIAHGQSYSSSLNLVALVVGIFLMQGSLKTARWVAMGAAFFFAAGALVIVTAPFMYPAGYWAAVLRDSTGLAAPIGIAVALLAMLFWVCRQLLRPEVVKAQQAAGIPAPRIRRAAAIGAILSVVLVFGLSWMLRGETAQEAIRRAHQQLSGNYQYVVTSIQVKSNSAGKNVAALVVAYNDTEVRKLVVKWKE